jgi:hypothetical protein
MKTRWTSASSSATSAPKRLTRLRIDDSSGIRPVSAIRVAGQILATARTEPTVSGNDFRGR